MFKNFSPVNFSPPETSFSGNVFRNLFSVVRDRSLNIELLDEDFSVCQGFSRFSRFVCRGDDELTESLSDFCLRNNRRINGILTRNC